MPRPEPDIAAANKKRVRNEPEVRRAKARRAKEEAGDAPKRAPKPKPRVQERVEEDVIRKLGRIVPNVPLKG